MDQAMNELPKPIGKDTPHCPEHTKKQSQDDECVLDLRIFEKSNEDSEREEGEEDSEEDPDDIPKNLP